MPRASWRGFLRLSLVSCPVYLSPAATRTKSIRLHQVWQPRLIAEPEDELPDERKEQEITGASRPALIRDHTGPAEDQSSAATRIRLRPYDPASGEEVEKEEVAKGYEYERGQFVTFTPEELKALDVESSEVIDLEKFVPRGEIDPVYFNSPYYLYPDGPIAVETLRVIGAAMAELGVVGIARLTLSRRERPVMVEPRGTGMALFTLRVAEEVRAAQFGTPEGDLNAEMVAIAGAIIKQRTGVFDPRDYRDRYQEALRELIEAKMKGLTVKPREIAGPPPVIDLMAALKRSLAQKAPTSRRAEAALNQRLDASLAQFAGRPLVEAFPYLILDARYERVRESGVIASQAVLMAIGIDWDGRRQVLAVELANRESRSSWREFLLGLKARGLHGVEFVVADDHAGLRAALREVLAEAAYQRCYVHFLRNALDYVPRRVDDDCLQELRGLYDRRDLAEARRDLAAWLTKWSGKYPKLTGWVEEKIDETLTFYCLPRQHHKHLKSTNMLERLNEEIRRRTYVVRIFPNGESCLRLVRALAVETHENWLEQHRYLNMDDLREHKKEALRRAA